MEITAKAKPFRSEAMGAYRFSIDTDGTVRVWDSVAGHYTVCHSLSARSIDRIRKLARQAR